LFDQHYCHTTKYPQIKQEAGKTVKLPLPFHRIRNACHLRCLMVQTGYNVARELSKTRSVFTLSNAERHQVMVADHGN
jgi:hypothetical protein